MWPSWPQRAQGRSSVRATHQSQQRPSGVFRVRRRPVRWQRAQASWVTASPCPVASRCLEEPDDPERAVRRGLGEGVRVLGEVVVHGPCRTGVPCLGRLQGRLGVLGSQRGSCHPLEVGDQAGAGMIEFALSAYRGLFHDAA